MTTNFEELGFEVNYTLHPKFVVKSTGAGEFNGRNYKASLKIFTRNVTEKLNLKTQAQDEVIEEITFKIPCESNELAGDLLDVFRRYREKGQIVKILGDLPSQNREVLVLNDPMEFLSNDIKAKQQQDVKKG